MAENSGINKLKTPMKVSVHCIRLTSQVGKKTWKKRMNADGAVLLSFFKSFSRNCHFVNYISLPEHSPMDLVHVDEIIASHHLLGCFNVTKQK